MADPIETLAATKTALLTTFKRDGDGVGTPVSVAVAGGRAYFRTWSDAWKAKRLARDPRAVLEPATLRGRPRRPAIEGRAVLVEGDEAAVAAAALAARHVVLQRVLVPTTHRLMRYRTLHYEFIPNGGVK